MIKEASGNMNPAPLPGRHLASASGQGGDWKDRMPTSVKGPIIIGSLIGLLFIGGFGVWGATVPIAGAAVASGVVAASGSNLAIDHLEGGVVARILVDEGDRVREGDILIELEETRALAEVERVRKQLIGLKARLARAVAERDEEAAFAALPDLLAEATENGLLQEIDQQVVQFRNRLQRHQSEMEVLRQRNVAINDEIAGLKSQAAAEETKLAVTTEELRQKEELLSRGLTQRSQVTSLQRAVADSQGRIGALQASIAQRNTTLIENETQMTRLASGRREEASGLISETQLQINDLQEQLRSRLDVLARTVIKSPANGVVVKLNKNTVGGTVRPSEPVVEILPTGSELIIEARVAPQDIDIVRPGQQANVRFVALNSRTTPEVAASVTYVSADRLVDPESRAPYYTARLKLSGELPEPLSPEQIYPGMPVDAFIGTGERTFFQYLVRPIYDSFSRAFREE